MFKIISFLTVFWVCSALPIENLAIEVENVIKSLKLVNYESLTGLEPFTNTISSLSENSAEDRRNFAILFSEKGGVDELLRWIDNMDFKNSYGYNRDVTKSYAAHGIKIMYHGSSYAQFCDKVISNGLLEKLLPFMFKEIIFNDPDFTSDFFTYALLVLDNMDIGNLAFESHSIMKKVFGDDLAVLHRRFEAENSSWDKLLLAEALLQRRFSEFSEFEMKRMSVDKTFLLRIRDELLSNVLSLHDAPQHQYMYQLKTAYVAWRLPISPITILHYFNALLLSESNRIQLCDQTTFDCYFVAIDLFAGKVTGFEEYKTFCINSLRGLSILSHSCPQFKRYFQKTQMNQLNKLAAIPKTDKFAIVQKETELLLKVIQSDTKCPKDHLKFDLNTYGVQSICYWAGATADYSELTSQLPSSVATIQHDFTEKEAQITEAPKIRSTTNNNEPVITTPKSDDTGKQLILVGLIGLGLTIVGVVALGILLLKKKKESSSSKSEPLVAYVPTIDDVYDYIESNEPRVIADISQYINLEPNSENRLGTGKFGNVIKSDINFSDVSITVAVKHSAGVENQATLETEGKLMARMKPHVNVLKQLIFKLSLISARNHQFVAITRDELHKV